MRRLLVPLVLLGLLAAPAGAETKPRKPEAGGTKIKPADWVFLDNGVIRLGVKKTAGAGIGWLSRSGSGENLLDHWDGGRLIQQSYYGKEDGSRWVDKPWKWNPVQGGDYQGNPSKVLELKHDKTTLRSRVHPRNWAGGELLTDCEMTQDIRLEGRVAIVKFGFRYTGADTHPARHQEVPATFVNPLYGTMVIYEGDKPWTGAPLARSRPGWPNESRKIPENWVAWVNDKNVGVGVYSSIAQELTCYRFLTPEAPSACSYVAPLVTFAISPGLHFEYEAALTLGTPEEMRAAFAKLKDSLPPDLKSLPGK